MSGGGSLGGSTRTTFTCEILIKRLAETLQRVLVRKRPLSNEDVLEDVMAVRRELEGKRG